MKSLKVAISAFEFRTHSPGGSEIYFRNLVESLYRCDPINEYLVLINNIRLKKSLEPFIGNRIRLVFFSSFFFRITDFLWFQLYNRLKYPGFDNIQSDPRRVSEIKKCLLMMDRLYGKYVGLDRFDVDLVHFPVTIIDRCFLHTRLPVALTIHDIQQEYYPDFFRREEKHRRADMYPASALRADIILAISHVTRRSLIEKYGVDPGKIIVSYQGCPSWFHGNENAGMLKHVKKKYRLPARFLLYPAGTWPHKNHINLVKALYHLKTTHGFCPALVMTGTRQNYHEQVMAAVRTLHLVDKVFCLGFVDFKDYPALYALADFLIFPSLFEGFGIPLVEAMAAGLPILCSDRWAVPEVVGNAGLYFNPENPADISQKILHAWNNRELSDTLIKNGAERLKMFTWKKAAEKHVMAFQKIVGKRPPTKG